MVYSKAIPAENDTFHVAGALAQAVMEGAVIYLHGELGAGKTTFTRGFLRALGYQGKVKSPTYTLVEPYEIKEKKIYHFDLYRLQTADELTEMGMRDYFSEENICLIEWPEKGSPFLPNPDLDCYIELTGQMRHLRIEARSSRGEKMLQAL